MMSDGPEAAREQIRNLSLASLLFVLLCLLRLLAVMYLKEYSKLIVEPRQRQKSYK